MIDTSRDYADAHIRRLGDLRGDAAKGLMTKGAGPSGPAPFVMKRIDQAPEQGAL